MCRIAAVAGIMFGLMLPLSVWAQGDDALTVAAQQVADRFIQAAEAKRGEVAEVDDTTTPITLYVGLGQGDGVLEGQLLDVVAIGDPIIIAGETVGFKERPVAIAEVVRVQGERLCIATVKRVQPGQQPAKGNMAYVKAAPTTLAVSTFLRPDNAATLVGQEFADKLGMALQTTGRFRMVERTRLEAALAELKLGLNDLFDPVKAARLGQQLQAKGVVLGTITQQNDRYSINVRVVDIETGTQVLTAAAVCGRSDELDKKYSQVIATDGGSTGGGAIVPPPPPPVETKRLFLDISAEEAASDQVRFEKNISIGDIIFREPVYVGFKFDDRKKSLVGTVSFLLNREWSRCTLTFGYDKMWGWTRIPAGQLIVKGDGILLADSRIEADRANQVAVDVAGVDTLVVTFEHAGERWGPYSQGLIFGDCCVSKGGPP
jgi:TolB-like protein